MSLNSIRRAIAAWISPDDDATTAEIAGLTATIKTLKDQAVANQKELADSSAALATSAAQLSTLTGVLAAKDQTIATDVAEISSWEAAADTAIAENADAKAKIDAAVSAATPVAPAQ